MFHGAKILEGSVCFINFTATRLKPVSPSQASPSFVNAEFNIDISWRYPYRVRGIARPLPKMALSLKNLFPLTFWAHVCFYKKKFLLFLGRAPFFITIRAQIIKLKAFLALGYLNVIRLSRMYLWSISIAERAGEQ